MTRRVCAYSRKVPPLNRFQRFMAMTDRSRRRFLARLGAVGLASPLVALPWRASAQDAKQRYFRIGTSALGGAYFPIGSILANAISSPPGSRPCDRGGSCGVPGLIAVAQSTQGSVQNVREIGAGRLESGLAQADVGYWAHSGKGIFAADGAIEPLRLIANLFPEHVQLITRKEAKIKSVHDLAGKRIGLGDPDSGTLANARLVLRAFGLRESRLKPAFLPPTEAAMRVSEGALDGFFFVSAAPAAVIAGLAERTEVDLVPLTGKPAEALVKSQPFFTKGTIPKGAYKDSPAVDTLTVQAQWLVSSAIDADTVYGITRALWHPSTGKLLREGHAAGSRITLDTALIGRAIPLHPGAARFYKEKGMAD
jgi:TRAP transporter TAXI family solute receptor